MAAFSFQGFLKKEIDAIRDAGLFREMKMIDGRQGPWVEMGGRKILLLASNDYLGLASDPELVKTFQEAVERYGTGSGASRLISGNMAPHEKLERALAEFKGTESALLFNSGYHAGIGTIPALFGKGDLILCDKLNHASLLDGCRLSRAEVFKYPHKDCEVLRKLLSKNQHYKKKLILTDGVFSMDGDIAPLPDLADLAGEYGAVLMVDDAHATGVLGKSGRGTPEHFGLAPERVDIHMGTLGKALGCFGAFIAGREELIRFLVNKARSFIFTTALPPALAAAAAKALEMTRDDSSRRERLWENARYLREGLRNLGLDIMESTTPIIPIFTGDSASAMKLSARLLEEGVFVQGIRPPAVPPGKARLRVTVTAAHAREDLMFGLRCFERVFEKKGK